MSAILGIDAAWTPGGSSGIALIRKTCAGCWECVRVEAGYSTFLNRSDRPPSGLIPAKDLIQYAEKIAETSVSLVVADMPLSRNSIATLRFADKEVGRRFGIYGCSTHTPNPTRPGVLSEHLRDGFEKCGLPLATCANNCPDPALIETYPHPALLTLMNASYRVKYKVTKNKKYWPTEDKSSRMVNLVRALREIRSKLSASIANIDLEIPEIPVSFSVLKPIEDKIDALICAWVGIQVLDGKAEPIGDESAAIWLPRR